MQESHVKDLPMMALRETVVFPGTMTPFVVGRPASVRALAAALGGDRRLFLVAQRDPAVEGPNPADVFSVGTIANIVQSLKLPDGNIKVLMEGAERAELVSISDGGGFFQATVRTATYQVERTSQLEGLISRIAKLGRPHEEEGLWRAIGMEDPGKLADLVGESRLEFREKQELLEVFDPMERLQRVAEMLATGHLDVTISMAVLTRWAESCAMMDRLGGLLREELAGRNRSARIRDLGDRSRRLARHLAEELAVYGASKP
jgi:ATP-dependent Lon protease